MVAILFVPLVVVLLDAAPVTVTFRVTAPPSTPDDATLFLSGDFQAWDPAAPGFALEARGGNVHEITREFAAGTRITFRFTRGDDATAERDPHGREVRRVLRLDTDRTFELTVARWADTVDTVERTLTGDVTEHEVPGFLDGRRVWVYRPPGARDGNTRYPVHVMLDGQNVFDASTGFAGEWQVDETCERLIDAGAMRPVIVVAIDHGGPRRVQEYTPTVDARRGVGGGADAHFTAIREVLMPWIEATLPVLVGPQNTGFSGSSLGGLMSLLAAVEHDDVFGRIGAVSPSIWWDERVILEWIAAAPKPEARLWVDMGTDEGSTRQGDRAYVDDLARLRAVLVEKGLVEGRDLEVFVDEGGRHDETTWAARYDRVLRFLYPPR